jgi:hypothetical protein
MKHCPKCQSSRIRRGYAHDSLLIRMFGFRELLCDSCNLRFRGFVIPGTLPRSGRHKSRGENQDSLIKKRSDPSIRTVRARPEAKLCPTCSSPSTHRSHRRGLVENLISVVKVYPYKCDDCNNRFLSKRKRSVEQTAEKA